MLHEQPRVISHAEIAKLFQTWQQRALIPGTPENAQFLNIINLAEMNLIAIYESIVQYFLQTYLMEKQQEQYEADKAAYEAETAGNFILSQPTEIAAIPTASRDKSKSSDTTPNYITTAMQANNQAWKLNIQQSTQAVIQTMVANNITIPSINNKVISPTSALGKRIIAVSLGAESPPPAKVLNVVYKSILEYNKTLPAHDKMVAPTYVKQVNGNFSMMNQLRVIDLIRESFFVEEEAFSTHGFTILKTLTGLNDIFGFIKQFNDEYQAKLQGQKLPTKLDILYKAINIAKLAAQTEFNNKIEKTETNTETEAPRKGFKG